MIPLPVWPWWPWVRKLWWLVPVTLLLVVTATYRIQRDHARDELKGLRATLAAQEATYKAQVAEAARVTKEAEAGYAAELERLRRAAGAVPVVRMCVGPVPEVPRLGATVPGDGGTGPAGGGVPSLPHGAADDAFDYGPGLYGIADRADRCSAQVRHLLDRNRRLSAIASEAE